MQVRSIYNKIIWTQVFFSYFFLFFFYQGFSFTDIDYSQDSRGREGTIFYSTLSHIFNRNACIYQTATRWDLPPYRITIWLIDDVMLIFVCLLVDLILGFVTVISHKNLELASTIIFVLQANRLTKCASHPTNQVCWTQVMFCLRVFGIGVYSNHKSNHHLLVLVIFPGQEMIQFWSVEYIFQICKLYLLSGICLKFWTMFLSECFDWNVNVSYFQHLLNILYSYCRWNCFFWYFFLGGWKLLFCDEKIFKIFRYLCTYFGC